MKNLSLASGHRAGARRLVPLRPRLAVLALLALLLAGRAARAQAPAWAGAASTHPPAVNLLLNGTSVTLGTAVEPVTGNVYITGSFTGTIAFGNIQLTSAGGNDLFVAKWSPTAQAWTSAVRGGGLGNDQGSGIAVIKRDPTSPITTVHVTGFFTTNATTPTSSAVIAGTTLAGAGGTDMFVAAYRDRDDNTDGLVPAAGGGRRGGGASDDQGTGIAVVAGTFGGVRAYVTGSFAGSNVSIANSTVTSAGSSDIFLAVYQYNGSSLDSGSTVDIFGTFALRTGGSGFDAGTAVAAVATGTTVRVYLTGQFSGTSGATIAGTTFTAAGSVGAEVFIAKYTDTLDETQFALPVAGNAVSGGSRNGANPLADVGQGITAFDKGGVNVVMATGYFTSSPGSSFNMAREAVGGRGGNDVFLVGYLDFHSGSYGGLIDFTTAAVGGGLRSMGSTGNDEGRSVLAAPTTYNSSTQVYVAGYFTTATGGVTVDGVTGATTIVGAGTSGQDIFVAAFTLRAPFDGLDYNTGIGAGAPSGSSFDSGYALALNGSSLYLGAGLGASGGTVVLGGNPACATPASSAVLGRLDAGTLALQRTDGPAQNGGVSSSVSVLATAVAPNGDIYATGSFSGVIVIGDQRLVSSNTDMWVARYRPGASNTTGTWSHAQRGGGTGGGADQGTGIAVRVSGGVTSVYVAGTVNLATGAGAPRIAGEAITATSGNNVFVAKLIDDGTRLTTAGGGAVVSGTGGDLSAAGLALGSANGQTSVYVTGRFTTTSATLAGSGTLSGSSFLAKYIDDGTGLSNGGAILVGSGSGVIPTALAVRSSADGLTSSIYLTGYYFGSSNTTIAGTSLTTASNEDIFVARYTDNGTNGTNSLTNGGAVKGGGFDNDRGLGIAVGRVAGVTSVYVTGFISSNNSITLAGRNAFESGNVGTLNMFVAKYTDPGTGGLTGASYLSGGSTTADDRGLGIGVGFSNNVASVYVTGYISAPTPFGQPDPVIAGTTLTSAGNRDVFLARYLDPGTGLTETGGGAVRGGGTSTDEGFALTIANDNVYVGGSSSSASAVYGPTTLNNPNAGGLLARSTLTGLSPLPVELTVFTATADGPAAVRLAWATASEKNSARFEVERSADGETFVSIGAVAAAGSSSGPRRYELLDARLPAGAALLYYRLRQVDRDGTFSYSPVRAVALKGAGAGLALFPNPAPAGHGPGGAATLTGALPGTAVTVRDALSRLVTSATADAAGTAALTLPAGLPAGVYVVRAGVTALRLAVE